VQPGDPRRQHFVSPDGQTKVSPLQQDTGKLYPLPLQVGEQPVPVEPVVPVVTLVVDVGPVKLVVLVVVVVPVP